MKHRFTSFILLSFAVFLLSSCYTTKHYYEVVEFRSASKDSTAIPLENNELKVSYDVWNQGGLFTFKIYNKTDSAIIINWAASSLVIDSVVRNYNGNGNVTVNASTTATIPYYNRSVSGNLNGYNYSATSTTNLTTQIQNPPDITLLPPHTYIESSVYKADRSFHNAKDEITDKSEIKVYQFDSSATPFSFRNIICYSEISSPAKMHFFDIPFWVSQVSVMGEKQFIRYKYDNQGYESGWVHSKKKPNAYYNEISDRHMTTFGALGTVAFVGALMIVAVSAEE